MISTFIMWSEMLLKRISILLITLRFVSCSSMWPMYHGQCSMCTWKICFLLLLVWEGNGNPLQYSCLENPVDRGAWWAAAHRVIQSQIWLKWLSMHVCIGEGNGSPLQYSCLENPQDGGAWWAAIYGVIQGRTWLKWLNNSSSCFWLDCSLYIYEVHLV